MSHIYIIAGPPGVGKSTTGDQYIDPDLDILNEDDMRFKYKEKGYADYNEYSIHRVRDIIRKKLIRGEDFALELNLGYPHQYEYTRSIMRFSAENKLNVILFFTDSLQLCKDRAKIRFESGRHLVKPDIVEQMYNNTIPLLKTNFDLFDRLLIVNTNDENQFDLIAVYDKSTQSIATQPGPHPNWFEKDVHPFINQQLSLISYNDSNLRSLDDDIDFDVGESR